MNTLPSELIAVPKFHGYFWNPTQQVLYSIKVGGFLRPLALSQPFYIKPGYRLETGFSVSRNGKKRRLSLEYLRTLLPNDYQVPYEHEIGNSI
jgi:hypothetical protein